MTVSQDAVGSGAITATAIFPRFSGNNAAGTPEAISRGFFETPASDGGFGGYAFYAFDADTTEVIDIPSEGRPGVRKRWISDSLLEIVDPLILPASALGRNIRVGFVTYYYVDPFTTPGVLPFRYAALSAPILMRLSGSSGGPVPIAALQQFAVPAGTAASACGSLAPAHVDEKALSSLRSNGWSVSYAQWPNAGAGGWVCSRQPVYSGSGWTVQ